MENNTGRIYEILKLLNGTPTEVMRDVLHRAWPVNFQITKLSDGDYEKFKNNISRLLVSRGYNNGVNHNGNGGRMSGNSI